MNEPDPEVLWIEEYYVDSAVSAGDRGDSLVHALHGDNVIHVPESSQKSEQVHSRGHCQIGSQDRLETLIFKNTFSAGNSVAHEPCRDR